MVAILGHGVAKARAKSAGIEVGLAGNALVTNPRYA
jgi:hypothetical protein